MCGFIFIMQSCTTKIKEKSQNKTSKVVKEVDKNLFLTDDNNITIKIVDCTLSDGTTTKCYEITTKSVPTDHQAGPWCPETITDSADKSGNWFKDGKVYKADGAFFKEVATLYNDEKWKMHADDGTIFKTKTKDDCLKLAGAQLLDDYVNFCIECLPEYVADKTKTYKIPVTPIKLKEPTQLTFGPPKGEKKEFPKEGEKPKGPPPGGNKRGPISRGLAFNGVVFDAPAPLHLILAGYTIPAFDDAGGHVNMDAGYHYHAHTGKTKKIKQDDGHAAMIGYAMDGFPLYEYLDEKGNPPTGLDECRGQYDEVRGYHYHVDAAGNNNFINCFSGATAE